MIRDGWDLALIVGLFALMYIGGYEAANIEWRRKMKNLAQHIDVRPVYLERLIEQSQKKKV